VAGELLSDSLDFFLLPQLVAAPVPLTGSRFCLHTSAGRTAYLQVLDAASFGDGTVRLLVTIGRPRPERSTDPSQGEGLPRSRPWWHATV
jgi:hypothetical protein